MDQVSPYYREKFKSMFMEKSGNSFQDFFSEIMEAKYPGDFQSSPWGKFGDRKNDGYIKSKRMLFQVYAPIRGSQEKFFKKIEGDFEGALPYWRDYFDQWIFVHNSREGLSSDVQIKLLDLEKQHNEIKILTWGFPELERKYSH